MPAGRRAVGCSVIQQQEGSDHFPQATYLQGYDQVPTTGDILAITDALLDGRLKATPSPEVPVSAWPTPPPMCATNVVPTVTPLVPPTITALP